MGKRVKEGSDHMKSLLSPKKRAAVYAVFLALSPVAVYYGFVTDNEAGIWLTAIGGILGVSNALALSNVPGVTKIKETEDAGT